MNNTHLFLVCECEQVAHWKADITNFLLNMATQTPFSGYKRAWFVRKPEETVHIYDEKRTLEDHGKRWWVLGINFLHE